HEGGGRKLDGIHTPEKTRLFQSMIVKERFKDPIFKAKHQKALKECWSEEDKEYFRQTTKAMWSDPVMRAKIQANHRGWKKTPEQIQNYIKANKQRKEVIDEF